MKSAVEFIEGIVHKLRIMGIPLDGPAHVKADNRSVIGNAGVPESMLKDKNNSIAHHFVRELVVCTGIHDPTAFAATLKHKMSSINIMNCSPIEELSQPTNK